MIELNIYYIFLGWILIYILGKVSKHTKLHLDIWVWLVAAITVISSFLYIVIKVIHFISPVIIIG